MFEQTMFCICKLYMLRCYNNEIQRSRRRSINLRRVIHARAHTYDLRANVISVCCRSPADMLSRCILHGYVILAAAKANRQRTALSAKTRLKFVSIFAETTPPTVSPFSRSKLFVILINYAFIEKAILSQQGSEK